MENISRDSFDGISVMISASATGNLPLHCVTVGGGLDAAEIVRGLGNPMEAVVIRSQDHTPSP